MKLLIYSQTLLVQPLRVHSWIFVEFQFDIMAHMLATLPMIASQLTTCRIPICKYIINISVLI